MYWEIIAVCFKKHTEDTNALCGKKVEFFFIIKLGGK
jgi:hypothetical protein